MENSFFKNIINLKDKELKWHNTNFFYVSTILMIIAMIIGYVIFKSQTHPIVAQNNFWNVYLISFNHSDIVHITFNSIMFVLLSLLLERHFGSFTYFIMLLVIIPISNIAYFAAEALLIANHYDYQVTWSGCGESCVNNFLLGFVLILVAFNYKKYIMSKNAYVFFIPFAINVFLSSVNSNDILTPADFFTNPSMRFMDVFYTNTAGHFYPFLVGIIIGVLIFTILFTYKVEKNKSQVNSKEIY